MEKYLKKKNLLFGYVISVDIVMKEQLLLKLVQYVDTLVLTLLRKTTITNHINDVEDMCENISSFFHIKRFVWNERICLLSKLFLSFIESDLQCNYL